MQKPLTAPTPQTCATVSLLTVPNLRTVRLDLRLAHISLFGEEVARRACVAVWPSLVGGTADFSAHRPPTPQNSFGKSSVLPWQPEVCNPRPITRPTNPRASATRDLGRRRNWHEKPGTPPAHLRRVLPTTPSAARSQSTPAPTQPTPSAPAVPAG